MAEAEGIPHDLDERPLKKPRIFERTGSPSQQSDTGFDDTEDFYNGPASSRIPLTSSTVYQHEQKTTNTVEKKSGSIPGLAMLESSEDAKALSPAENSVEHDVASMENPAAVLVIDTLHQEHQTRTGSLISHEHQLHTNHGPTNTAYDSSGNTTQDDKGSTPKLQKSEATAGSYAMTEDHVAKVHPDVATDTGAFSVKLENPNVEEAEWAYDSSDATSNTISDATTSPGSSTSGNNSENETYELLGPEEQARLLMQEEAGSDDGGKKHKPGSRTQPRTANEKPDEVVGKPDIIVTPQMNVLALGFAEGIVENYLLIRAMISGETRVLESGSVLCLEDRTVIGVIAETLGRVDAPLYSVAFTNPQEIKDYGIAKDTKIYYVESHSTFVFTQPLKLVKGSDASNLHDEEIADDELEFSDDEAEAEHKRKIKLSKLAKKGILPAAAPATANQSKSFLSRARKDTQYPAEPINYDDEEGDGLYTPLARPASLLEPTLHPKPTTNFKHFGGAPSRGRDGRGRGGRNYKGNARSGRKHRDNDRSSSLARTPDQNRPPLETNPSRHLENTPHPYPSFQDMPSQYGAFTAPNMPSPDGPPPRGHWPGIQQFPSWTQDYSRPVQPYGAPYGDATTPGGSIPPGSFVNPAFFRNQQLFSPALPNTQHYAPAYHRSDLQGHSYQSQLPTGLPTPESNSASKEYDPTRPWIN